MVSTRQTNDRLEEHKESLLEDERDLSNIFQLGVVRQGDCMKFC
jgi:hypothetical protein